MQKKKVALAFQGGGSHGAFAWGVADRLLEDGRFDIVGVSGTSAGGMNAAALVQGLIKGGPELARITLKDYWQSVYQLSKKTSPYMKDPFEGHDQIKQLLGKFMPQKEKSFNLDKHPLFPILSHIQTHLSPYQLNPDNKNPFGEFLKDFFDFKAIRNSKDRKIFLGTTHVKSGKIRVFSNDEFSPEVLMASACLPFIFQSVKIDNEYYWDGGYIANPAIYPLINNCDCEDIILVQLRKTYCDKLPQTQQEIDNRLKEITYNGCLVHEMRAIYFITKLIDDGVIKEGAMKRVNMHLIKNEDSFKGLNLSSALNTDWEFLMMLFEEGRKSASEWIGDHFDKVGAKKHSIDTTMFGDFV
ncbi:MAG: patatin-like phospholipase family protein [Alphaproteobacteria bacterium]|nr:patatin-like phospholipase family protein [Alphaproteobacteria bacterium]